MRAQKGFTLIETLIYLALFTIIIGGLVASAYGFFESIGRNQTHSMLQEEQDFLMAKIDWALSGVNPSGANTYGTSLSVTKYDGTQVQIDVLSGKLRIKTNAGSWNELSNENVTVSKLDFIHTTSAGINAPESIEAGFTISTKTQNGMSLSQTASSTRYLRK